LRKHYPNKGFISLFSVPQYSQLIGFAGLSGTELSAPQEEQTKKVCTTFFLWQLSQ